MQLIDARDIAAFTLDHAESGTSDRFVTSGGAEQITFAGWLAECARATGATPELIWIEDRFLLANGVRPWTELPLWAPRIPAMAGVWSPSSTRALAAGLHCRSLADTVRDTWLWLKHIPEDQRSFGTARLHHCIDPDKEARLLADWSAQPA
jgi:2'-hydroxyisoflavone reductase